MLPAANAHDTQFAAFVAEEVLSPSRVFQRLSVREEKEIWLKKEFYHENK
jgi:hypothetical protein